MNLRVGLESTFDFHYPLILNYTLLWYELAYKQF